MQHDEYKLITTGRGAKLRDLMHDAIKDARDLPGRKALRAKIEELLPDEDMAPVREALEKKFVEVARAGQDRRQRFELRGKVDRWVLDACQKLEAADRLMPVQEEEVIDMDAVLQASDKYSDRIGGDLDRAHDEEVAKAQEIVRKAGLA